MSVLTYIKKLYCKIAKTIRSNIKYKLFFIYVVVITVPILIFGLISYTMSSSTLQNDYINYKKKLNDQIVKNIDENLSNLIRQSMAVYTNIDDLVRVLNTTTDKLETTHINSYNHTANYFSSLLQGNNRIYGVSIISLNGEIKLYLDRHVGNINLYNVSDEPWFKQTLSMKGRPLLLEPHLNKFVSMDNYDRKPVISLARSIIDLNSDKPCGIMLIDQDVSELSGIAINVEIEKNELVIIYGKTGSIIHSNTDLKPDEYKKVSSLLGPNSSIKTYFKGEKVLITSSQSKEFGWKVVSLLPMSDIEKKSSFIRNINFTLLFILIFFTFIISIFFSYLITAPLKRLMTSFSKLQKGDFNTKVSVRGDDEIAQIGSTFNTMVTSMKSLIQQKYEANILRKLAELEALQSQINPHFLFNTLNSIKAVSDLYNIDKISLMIKSLSDLFRYNLNRGIYIVKFSEELDNIKKYLYLQECRFAEKYEVLFDIDAKVLDYDIVRLTLQPIVENALYHGLEPKRRKGELQISAQKVNDRFNIYISNNGVEIPEDELGRINDLLEINPEEYQKVNPEKLGIFNVNARIKYHFGNEYGIKLSSFKGGYTTVKVTLPVRSIDGTHS